ncbi:FixH family protein [Pseudoroseomonas ludipueritiae]|uniref:FixH family protein n=1 Tax=Pseudoroseomonas ludipueritiae TaxID=198093 RepID=A0ABR7R4V6_9PROT|nr:FixH family protein [Pseudoroseomonas ludipueritiae]MBC9176755.1 FixH family protein [Pseudoroseomonas ludipueritiae]
MSITLPVEVAASMTLGGRKPGRPVRFYAGTSLRAVATFLDRSTSQPVDVSDVAFMVRDPTGDEIAVPPAAVAKLGPGVFAIALAVEMPGTWHVVARCSIPSHTVAVASFDVVALPASKPLSAIEYLTTADGRFIYMTSDGSLVVKPA